MVAGHLQEKNGLYYIVLTYPDAAGKRKNKWISTKLPVKGNKLHAFLENASRWMKTRHKYGRMKAHGMRPAFYAATSARNKLVFALPLNHKLSMP